MPEGLILDLLRSERPGGVDKRDVGQGLREVPHESTMSWIVLFAE